MRLENQRKLIWMSLSMSVLCSALVSAADSEPLRPGILIGRELKEILKVKLGDLITLADPQTSDPGPGGPVIRQRVFRVAGVFTTGLYEVDAKRAYLLLPVAQAFFGAGDSATGIRLRFDDLREADVRCAAVLARLGGPPYFTRSLVELNQHLLSSLKAMPDPSGANEDDWKTKLAAVDGHGVLLKRGAAFSEYRAVWEKIGGLPGLRAASPFLDHEAMINSEHNLSGVFVWGIEPASFGAVIELGQSLKEGRLDLLEHPEKIDDYLKPKRPEGGR